MKRKTARERYLLQFGMELSLLSTGDGWGWRNYSGSEPKED